MISNRYKSIVCVCVRHTILCKTNAILFHSISLCHLSFYGRRMRENKKLWLKKSEVKQINWGETYVVVMCHVENSAIFWFSCSGSVLCWTWNRWFVVSCPNRIFHKRFLFFAVGFVLCIITLNMAGIFYISSWNAKHFCCVCVFCFIFCSIGVKL